MIPYGRQDISRRRHRRRSSTVLRSDFLTQGPAVPRFEQRSRRLRRCARTRSRSTARPRRCTSPAWRSASVPATWLWTVPNTFLASANCARYCGADVDFVDIDPAHLQHERRRRWRAKLASAARDGTLPKVVMPVHFGGQRCDMARDPALADRLRLSRHRGRLARGRRPLRRASRSAAAASPTSPSSASIRSRSSPPPRAAWR